MNIAEQAKKVRTQLCIDCECKFDRGCGCLEAITAALKRQSSDLANALHEIIRIQKTNKIPDRHGRLMSACSESCLNECATIASNALDKGTQDDVVR